MPAGKRETNMREGNERRRRRRRWKRKRGMHIGVNALETELLCRLCLPFDASNAVHFNELPSSRFVPGKWFFSRQHSYYLSTCICTFATAKSDNSFPDDASFNRKRLMQANCNSCRIESLLHAETICGSFSRIANWCNCFFFVYLNTCTGLA